MIAALAVATAGFVPVTAIASSGSSVYRYVEADGTIAYTNVKPRGATAKKARKLFVFPRRASVENADALPLPSARNVKTYDEMIDAASTRYKIPNALVRAVMHAESSFDPKARSVKGAQGLMQLMPATADGFDVKDAYDSRENIEAGTRYLRQLANQFNGDMVKMIAAYNAGPEAVRKYKGNVPPYAETKAYVRKVLHLYYQYKTRTTGVTAAESATVEVEKG